jgi:hypothetical protein
VCSAVTRLVRLVVAGISRPDKYLLAEESGQLPNLGLLHNPSVNQRSSKSLCPASNTVKLCAVLEIASLRANGWPTA